MPQQVDSLSVRPVLVHLQLNGFQYCNCLWVRIASDSAFQSTQMPTQCEYAARIRIWSTYMHDTRRGDITPRHTTPNVNKRQLAYWADTGSVTSSVLKQWTHAMLTHTEKGSGAISIYAIFCARPRHKREFVITHFTVCSDCYLWLLLVCVCCRGSRCCRLQTAS